MINLIFRPAAAADVQDAYNWYEEQRPGLGEEFLSSLKLLTQEVAENPLRYPVVYRGTRRALLRRFPYGLFYRIMGDLVVIIACMHGSRNPRIWQSRS